MDGSRLRELRRALNLKLQYVAAAVGRSPSFICNLERGLIRSPEDIERVAALLREHAEFPVQSAEPRRSHDAA